MVKVNNQATITANKLMLQAELNISRQWNQIEWQINTERRPTLKQEEHRTA